ncbi:MAG: ABC transporter substrate-binding protein, partial [Gemmobacter sp.]
MGGARIGAVALSLAFAVVGGPAAAAPPGRVVSINLCTDQLAMMLAAPGQLVSVS